MSKPSLLSGVPEEVVEAERQERAFRAFHQSLASIFQGRQYLAVDEKKLQPLLAQTLADAGFSVAREVNLGAAGIIDMLVIFGSGKVGLEVKVKGSLADVTRQLFGYADVPEVSGIVLVTTRLAHANMPSHMRGKPLGVIVLRGGF